MSKRATVFSASWCGPCKAYKPHVDAVKAEGYDIQKVDIDENADLASKANVRGVPTTIIYDDNGKEVQRFAGMRTKSQLVEALKG